MQSEFAALFPLRKTRTHEVSGPAAIGFAFALAGQLNGTVLWITEAWLAQQINPLGFAPYLDPQQLLTAKTLGQADSLAVAEEALRSGAVALVVIETAKPLTLTEGRRLQLAAETGRATGLCLIPEGMGCNAAETRWHCAPIFDVNDSTLQRWELKKNKSGTLCIWDVRWDAETRRIIVVSKVAQQPGFARTPL